ncbi:uncharacterized protein LOC119395694 isoform X1 [Rhipicephalus sanguineus]|uniref:uncharacterized protein LOC119395694 isoform X1 n=1 Tax=Rhipicephalus sanguineus TaxID=34632 RepID=UPI001895DC13|nr:uncharacterized protein LOC119395694 isoform X1 [Rhipicephalus sanguineus]
MASYLRTAIIGALVLSCSSTNVVRAATDTNLYDVLRLIYTMCSAAPADLEVGVKCMDHYLGGIGGETLAAARKCLSTSESPLADLCLQHTEVGTWKANNSLPPPSLTGIISLSGLTKMMCIMGESKANVPRWQSGFSKCFPKEEDWLASRKALWFIARYLLSKQ